jgi:hypothetical protein
MLEMYLKMRFSDLVKKKEKKKFTIISLWIPLHCYIPEGLRLINGLNGLKVYSAFWYIDSMPGSIRGSP